MKSVLVGIALILTVLIVGFWAQKKPAPVVAMRTETEMAELPIIVQPEKQVQPAVEAVVPSTTVMPEPVLITVAQDASVIADEKLRRFVARNAVFSRDKVLYFEWRGGPSDKMEGTTASDLETKDKRYVVTLKTTQGESMLHRQVFIIPRNYTYEVEISK